jgi:HEAT repeat protein
MIEREILEILDAPADIGGERLNGFADQFRSGRDLDQLMTLLDSSNPRLVSIGAWILGEVNFHTYNSDKFISQLRELLDNEDPLVRFYALGAIYPALSRHSDDTHALLRKLRNDPNEGVRMSAEAAAARLGVP